ncbi:MAG TPA: SRPBCC family protein [Ideonella sp.]|jgi:hypothetical protein|nr:SRPBCC family protein [Ideonella sp.]
MPRHVQASHRIVIDAPVDRCFMLFTPAGEELWVDGWQPTYVHPEDGRTEAGMVFTTGAGDETTVWTLADFDRAQHRSRYLRCTPGSRTGLVEVRCKALEGGRSEVQVGYTMTALSEAGEQVLEAFEGERFAAMIDGWAREIAARREFLLQAEIR